MISIQRFLASGQKVQLSRPVYSGPLLLVDSSFNPPHRAHAKLAQIAQQEYPNGTVVLLLSTGNADKPSVSPKEMGTRIEMMYILAGELGPRTVIGLTTEAKFMDKAEALASAFPACKIVFALGFDTMLRILDQKYYREPVRQIADQLAKVASLVVLTRRNDEVSGTPDMGSMKGQEQLLETIWPHWRTGVRLVMAGNDTDEVSSSRARSTRAELLRCCTSGVVQYVLTHKLYQSSN